MARPGLVRDHLPQLGIQGIQLLLREGGILHHPEFLQRGSGGHVGTRCEEPDHIGPPVDQVIAAQGIRTVIVQAAQGQLQGPLLVRGGAVLLRQGQLPVLGVPGGILNGPNGEDIVPICIIGSLGQGLGFNGLGVAFHGNAVGAALFLGLRGVFSGGLEQLRRPWAQLAAAAVNGQVDAVQAEAAQICVIHGGIEVQRHVRKLRGLLVLGGVLALHLPIHRGMGDADLAEVRSVAQAQDDAGLNGDSELGRCGNAALGIGIRLIFHPDHGLGAAEGARMDALHGQQELARILRVLRHGPFGRAGALDLVSPGEQLLGRLHQGALCIRKVHTGGNGIALIDFQRGLLDDQLQVHGHGDGQVRRVGHPAIGIGCADDHGTGGLGLYGNICGVCGIIRRPGVHDRCRPGLVEQLGAVLGIIAKGNLLRAVRDIRTRRGHKPQPEDLGGLIGANRLGGSFRILPGRLVRGLGILLGCVSRCFRVLLGCFARDFRVLLHRLGQCFRILLGRLGRCFRILLGFLLLLGIRPVGQSRRGCLGLGQVLEEVNGPLVFHPVEAQHRPAAIVDVDRFAEGVGLGQNCREGIVQTVQQLLIAREAVLAVDGKSVFGGRHRMEAFLALGVISIQ